MEFVNLNPRTMYILSFVQFLMFIQPQIIDVIHCQQVFKYRIGREVSCHQAYTKMSDELPKSELQVKSIMDCFKCF
jgi:hypothetical protein